MNEEEKLRLKREHEQMNDERANIKVVEVYQALNVPEADLIKVILSKYDIDCFYSEFPLSLIRPVAFVTSDALSSVRIYIREDDVEKAKELITEYLCNKKEFDEENE